MSQPTQATPALPDVTLLTGPLVLGFMFGTGLYGILVVQVFLYHTSFPNDPRWIKVYVGMIFVLESIFSVFSVIAAWNTLGRGWGDLSRLSYLDWSSAPLPPISGVITSMVHGFYCWRIFKLTRHVILPIIIMAISLTSLSGTIALMVHLGIFGLDVDAVRSAWKVVTLWLAGAAVADILVAVTMVVILFKTSRAVGYKPTASRLQSLMKLVVETGVITSVSAILDCTLYLRFKDTNLHFIMFYMLAKLYSNTIMATLNSRVIFSVKSFSDVSDAMTDGLQHQSVFWADQVGNESFKSRSRMTNSVPMTNLFSMSTDNAGSRLTTDCIHISTVTVTSVVRDASHDSEVCKVDPEEQYSDHEHPVDLYSSIDNGSKDFKAAV